MSEVLVEMTREPLVECVHRGDVVVVDNKGNILNKVGDPYKVTFMRSAAKPVQAMEVIMSGAYDRFKFTEEELAIMCASHYGEDFHLKVVKSALDKMGLDYSKLLCGTTSSISIDYAMKLLVMGRELNPMYNNCSGKHSGMLAVCLMKGYPIEGYNEKTHILQREMKKLMAKMCRIDEDKLFIGVDGCTVPVYGMPIYNMALCYANMANPENLEPKYKDAANKIYNAMVNHPEMIAGTGGFCTSLMKATKGKIISKLGSDGVYCIGVKGLNIGIALKIEDGAMRALSPAAMQVLEDLSILTPEELEELKGFKIKPNRNNNGIKIGEIRPAFHLK